MPRRKMDLEKKGFSLNLPADHLTVLEREARRQERPVAYLIRHKVAELVRDILSKEQKSA